MEGAKGGVVAISDPEWSRILLVAESQLEQIINYLNSGIEVDAQNSYKYIKNVCISEINVEEGAQKSDIQLMPLSDLLISKDSSSSKAYSCCFRCSIGFLDYTNLADNDYKYVLIYQDNISKFIILKPLKEKDEDEIRYNLIKIFSLVGVPSKIFTVEDSMIKSVMEKEISLFCENFPIKIRRPKEADFEENESAKIDNAIKNWMKLKKSTEWSKGIYFVQFHLNSVYNATLRGVPIEVLFKPNYTYTRKKYTRYLIQKKDPCSKAKESLEDNTEIIDNKKEIEKPEESESLNAKDVVNDVKDLEKGERDEEVKNGNKAEITDVIEGNTKMTEASEIKEQITEPSEINEPKNPVSADNSEILPISEKKDQFTQTSENIDCIKQTNENNEQITEIPKIKEGINETSEIKEPENSISADNSEILPLSEKKDQFSQTSETIDYTNQTNENNEQITEISELDELKNQISANNSQTQQTSENKDQFTQTSETIDCIMQTNENNEQISETSEINEIKNQISQSNAENTLTTEDNTEITDIPERKDQLTQTSKNIDPINQISEKKDQFIQTSENIYSNIQSSEKNDQMTQTSESNVPINQASDNNGPINQISENNGQITEVNKNKEKKNDNHLQKVQITEINENQEEKKNTPPKKEQITEINENNEKKNDIPPKKVQITEINENNKKKNDIPPKKVQITEINENNEKKNDIPPIKAPKETVASIEEYPAGKKMIEHPDSGAETSGTTVEENKEEVDEVENSEVDQSKIGKENSKMIEEAESTKQHSEVEESIMNKNLCLEEMKTLKKIKQLIESIDMGTDCQNVNFDLIQTADKKTYVKMTRDKYKRPCWYECDVKRINKTKINQNNTNERVGYVCKTKRRSYPVKHVGEKDTNYRVGASVRVRVPVMEREKGFPNHILGIISEITMDGRYYIAVQNGTLRESFARDQLSLCNHRLFKIGEVQHNRVIGLKNALLEQLRYDDRKPVRCTCQKRLIYCNARSAYHNRCI